MTRIASTPTGYGRSGDLMGQAVAIDGDTALVAAPNALPAPLLNSGVVEVFREVSGAWQVEAVLLPDDLFPGMQFGQGVALGQDIAVVGSDQGYPGFTRAAYTFVRDGNVWTQTDKLTFGTAPSLSNDTLILTDYNIARVFIRSGNAWTQQADLQGDLSPDQGETVNAAVVDGDLAVISTVRIAGIHDYYVAEYFFARTNGTWVREAKIESGSYILPPPPAVMALNGQTAIIYAQVYVRDNGVWTAQGILDPGMPWDFEIPPSITLQGDVAVVGVPSDYVLGTPDVGTAYVFTRTGSTWTRTDRVYDPDGQYQYHFGASVDLSADKLLVGSPGAFTDAGAAGKATVFTAVQNDWNLTASLDEGDAHAGDAFGASVAMSASTIAVGAPSAETGQPFSTGFAYVFERAGNGWIEQARLGNPETPVTWAVFAIALALDQDTLCVGSSGYEESANETGSVYIYLRSGTSWDLQTRIGSGEPYSSFGGALALQGDLLAVGDAGWPNQVPDGRVRIFERSGVDWNEEPMVQAAENTDYDRFGAVIALSGDTLIVGAPGTNVEIEQAAGAAYIFQRAGTDWQEQARLLAPEPREGASFGMSVAVAGDTAIVGAGGTFGTTTGAAYVYTRVAGNWSLAATLAPPDVPPEPNSFGYTVALSQDAGVALVGMPYGVHADAPGVTYAFSRSGPDWVPLVTLHGSQYPATDDFGAALTFSGSEAVIGSPLEYVGGAAYVTSFADAVFSDGFEQTP